jgi:hypothetical protein
MMTKAQQRTFVRTLSRAVTRDILAHADDWPEMWDGHELRALCAAYWNREVTDAVRKAGKRRRAFWSAVYGRGLMR